MNIKWVGSPNFDKNRKPIDRIVIHWMVGNLASADAQFQKKDPGTSAHYGVEDENIHQYVNENEVAYHAGVYAMNQRSIGIEHSASPDRPASEKTYQTSGQLIREIAQRYNIPLDRTHIIKHSEVKATQCCGTVDIDKLIAIAKQGGSTTPDELSQATKDRDINWNLFNYLCTLLGVEVNPNDKEATKTRAGDKIVELQAKATSVSSLETRLTNKENEQKEAINQAKQELEGQFATDKRQWLEKEKTYLAKIKKLEKDVAGKIPTVLKDRVALALKILRG